MNHDTNQQLIRRLLIYLILFVEMRRAEPSSAISQMSQTEGGRGRGSWGSRGPRRAKPDEPREVLTPEVGRNPPVSGCFTRDLGFFRDAAGEITRPISQPAHSTRTPLGQLSVIAIRQVGDKFVRAYRPRGCLYIGKRSIEFLVANVVGDRAAEHRR